MSASEPKLRDIFTKAAECKNAEEQAAYLNDACQGDAALRAQLDELLRAQAEAGSFLQEPAASRAGTIDMPAEHTGAMIGPYKLLEKIGEGGMGTVWMAQQQEPVKRLVAVKLIKAGMDSQQVIARFEAERQALALMDHPNIARVLDGGTTGDREQRTEDREQRREDRGQLRGAGQDPLSSVPCPLSSGHGRPYFVMDLVRGVPITRYCDEHHLTPRQRLELFVPVCQAIQHAHQKGIIHRDLKPSNVLVALYDGRPVPKVIDFGVAKAAGQPLTDKTLITGFGAIVGTLEYMSPEQAEMNQLDIDTRSDIYALGVLLYELLTGSPPFSRKGLEKAGMVEMLRVIREEEPSKPSTKLSTAQGLPTLAANRGTEPAKLTRMVRGELDWIVMKALEKDRSRRYETANGFAMDVLRYLADEPVLAGPPSAWYRFRKFARRNRTHLALAAALLLLLLGAGVFAWYADRQAKERQTDADNRKLEEKARLGRNAEAVAALLDQCEAALRGERADQAALALGAAERRAADGGAEEHAARLEHCQADLKLLRDLDTVDGQRITLPASLRADAARRRDVLAAHGLTPPDEGPLTDTVERLNASLVRDRVLTSLDLWLSVERSPRVRALLQAADADPYRDAVRDVLLANNKIAIKILGANPQALAQPARFTVCLGQFGGIPEARRRVVIEAALKARPGDLFLLIIMAQTYKDGRQSAPERLRWLQAAVAAHPHSSVAHNQLGTVLDDIRDLDGAIFHYEEAIRLDPENPMPYANLGAIRFQKRDYDGAIEYYRKSVALNPTAVLAVSSWGRALVRKKDLKSGIAKHWEAIKIDPDFAVARTQLGTALTAAGDLKGAIVQHRIAVGLDPDDAAEPLTNWGVALWKMGDDDGALAKYEEAIKADPNHGSAHTNRGVILWKKGLKEEALAAFLEGIRLNPENDHAHCMLGVVSWKKGDLEKALFHMEKAVLLDPDDADNHNGLAAILSDLKRTDEAIKAWERAIQLDPKHDSARINLAKNLRTLGEVSRPAELFAELAAEFEKDGFRHEDSFFTVTALITCFGKLNRPDKAEPWHRKWLAVIQERNGRDSPEYTGRLAMLGRNLLLQHNWKDAEGVLRECLLLREAKSENTWQRFDVAAMVGAALLGQKRYAEAELPLLEGFEGMKKQEKSIPRSSRTRLAAAADCLVQVYEALRKTPDAAKWRALLEEHEGVKVAGVHEVGDGLRLKGKIGDKITGLVYEVKFVADKTYLIDMISPDHMALDPLLILQAADRQHLAQNDDGGSGLNARLTYRAHYDGVYCIHAIARKGDRGDFTLLVREKKPGEPDPKDAAPLIARGLILYRSKDFRGAIDLYKQVVVIDPLNVEAWNQYGTVLDSSKDARAAVDAFKTALALEPRNHIIWCNLGVASSHSNDVPGAIHAYQQTIDIVPKYATALNGLAWHLATCSDKKLRDPKRAVDLARKAVDIAPTNPSYPNTLGVAYYRVRDFKGAIAALEKSMELRKGGDSHDWFFLAMAHWELGDKGKAREWFDRAVQWMDKNSPTDEELRRFRAEAAELLGVTNKSE